MSVKWSILNHLLLFAVTVLSFGCSGHHGEKKIKEGIIIYDIAYKNVSGRPFPTHLLPRTMEMKFNSSYASYTMEDRLGFFSIVNITDLNTSINMTLIKVFDKRYVFTGESGQPPLFFKDCRPFEVKLLDDTCSLAGILCHKATVMNIASSQSFGILYSPDAAVKAPNQYTPYEKIDGLLMKFGIRMKNLDMNLTAKKFDRRKVYDNEFDIPEGYKYISKNQMEDIISTLLP